MKKILIFLSLVISWIYITNFMSAITITKDAWDVLTTSIWSEIDSITKKINVSWDNVSVDWKIYITWKLCTSSGKCLWECNDWYSWDNATASCKANEHSEIVKLVRSDWTTDNGFWYWVDISSDWNTAIILANSDSEKGLAAWASYIFIRSWDTWIYQAKLLPTDTKDRIYMRSVAISWDGNTAVMWGYWYKTNTTTVGAIFIFNRSWNTRDLWIKKVVSWALYLWYALDISDDWGTIVAWASQSPDKGYLSWSSHIFTGSWTSWSYTKKLTATDWWENELFWRSISVNQDWTVFVIGSNSWAYVFVNWSQRKKIVVSNPPSSKIKINWLWNTIVIGVSRDTYVYTGSWSSWNQIKKITIPSETSRIGDVDINDDWTLIMIWAPWDDDKGSQAWAVQVYEGSWANWTETKKMSAADTSANNQFWKWVSVSWDWKVLAVWTNAKKAYIFEK
jgi:hypothetical protein